MIYVLNVICFMFLWLATEIGRQEDSKIKFMN